MAKTLKHCFDRIASFDNLLRAAKVAAKGKRWTPSAMAFHARLDENLWRLHDELMTGRYRHSPYTTFWVNDSKRRLISAAAFRDRVVHHALMAVVGPPLERSFIPQSYACQTGKGTHAALRLFRTHLRTHRYVLKCDIRRYFPSIDHDILLNMLARKIRCERTLALWGEIINSQANREWANVRYFPGDDLFAPFARNRGLPVGNLTSQFCGNFYLDGFDHWVQRELRAGPYLRYVDDFCIFSDDKALLNGARIKMAETLANIRLELHPRKCRVFTAREGVEFLGFRHFEDHVRLRRNNVTRIKARLKRMKAGVASGRVEFERVCRSVQAWEAHARWGDTWALRKRLLVAYDIHRSEAGYEPGASWGLVEQQHEQPAGVQSQQEQSRQPEQQRVSLRVEP